MASGPGPLQIEVLPDTPGGKVLLIWAAFNAFQGVPASMVSSQHDALIFSEKHVYNSAKGSFHH